MSAVDAAWYQIDGPANTAMITSIAITAHRSTSSGSRPSTRSGWRSSTASAAAWSTAPALATPHWEEVPGFEIGQQLHHIACRRRRQGGAHRAGERSGQHATGRGRPLWEVHVVDGVDGGSALITRMHHCIGDGTASVLVARALFDTSPKDWRTPAAKPPRREAKPGLVERLFTPAIDAAEWSVAAVRSVVGGAIDAATHPQQLAETAALVLAGAGRWPPSC